MRRWRIVATWLLALCLLTQGPAFVTVQADTAPTLADYQQSNWGDVSAGSEVTPSITWSAGAVIVVLGMTSDNSATLGTPTATGLTFAALAGTPTNTASSCKGYAWSATAAGSGSGAVTATAAAGGAASRGISVFVYSGSDGLGTPAVSVVLGATTTQNLTRAAANSAVVQAWGDWNAVSDVVVTWTPGSETQRVAQEVAGAATFFVANWGDQGATGTTAYGFSGFAGADMTAITVEVEGTAGGAPAPTPQLMLLGVGGG